MILHVQAMLKRLLAVFCLACCLTAGIACLPNAVQAQDDTSLALVLTADGPVTPAMGEYLRRGLQVAERRGAEVVIFQLNTPGGSINAMNSMVQILRSSPVPVVVYVAPRGAMAASAGTVLTLAGQVSAMAPETIIGAASPVGAGGEELESTSASKEKNALKATIRTLMEGRPEQAVTLAESTIDSATAVSAAQALEAGMIDIVAYDLDDLLRQLDGREVTREGQTKPLNTAHVRVDDLPLSLIERLLLILTDPNVVFLLINIGVVAILVELSTPGGWVSGFIGVVCLALAVYGLGVLPVNWFGLIFLVMAFVLFILDIKAPTHGALTAAGVGSLIVGALVLFNSPGTPAFQRVSIPLVVFMSLFTAAIFFAILTFALRAQSTPIATGQESLLGKKGMVRKDLDPYGLVQLEGELWSAEAYDPKDLLPTGTSVEVVKVEGVRLLVKRAAEG